MPDLKSLVDPRPKLNLDVLLHIITFAEITVQSRMMKTCHALYRQGARHLLRQNSHWHSTERKLVSFILFLLADPPFRFPSLRQLWLGHGLQEGISSETGKMLTELFVQLGRAENIGLRELWLGKSEDILRADSRLTEAIASVTTLNSISIDDVGLRGAQLLKTLRSPLTSATISFKKDVHLNGIRVEDLNPTLLLEHSKDTLESLELQNGCFTALGRTVVYPRLTNLAVEGPWFPYISVLLRAFPNLLRLSTALAVTRTPPWVEDADLSSENRAYQLKHGSWRLNCFEGPSRDLYLLSLLYPIPHVVLMHENGDNMDAEILRTILSDARPIDLQLGPQFLTSNENVLNQEWMAALFESRNPHLRVLQLTLTVTVYTSSEDDEDEMLEEALEALRATVKVWIALKTTVWRHSSSI
ncbi:hypothetical protein L227DRAFT_615621 [Lentinus tigrinus ALCF2SS1-6]|uniref:F-box domain-containing protein n=1 Tax=Lentinus tigrinus ALCF2SS1-6 TaxID=1328759 RepID=A0A5C2RWZ4_9APHY|nr:hypothetical protein L227DRAFT_615621 [Lentinus tigrinus ALCF2SS1-6]